MPHDKNGQELKVGDTVNVPCVVDMLQIDTDYCNVTLKTVEPMFPNTTPTTLNLNTKQVVKA